MSHLCKSHPFIVEAFAEGLPSLEYMSYLCKSHPFIVEAAVAGIPYDQLTVSVPKEVHLNERRVALSPQACKGLIDKGFNVAVESGAGMLAKFTDQDYVDVGAKIVEGKEAYQGDIVLKVRVLHTCAWGGGECLV